MRFLHTADWHVGKKLNGFDLLAEQHDAFLKINQLAKDYKVDAVVVAGTFTTAQFQAKRRSKS